MELPLAKRLREAHEKELARIGDDLGELIRYVMEYEGFEHIDILDVFDPLDARVAATGQKPDYDMILGVLQNDLTPGPVSVSQTDELGLEDEYPESHACPQCGF